MRNSVISSRSDKGITEHIVNLRIELPFTVSSFYK